MSLQSKCRVAGRRSLATVACVASLLVQSGIARADDTRVKIVDFDPRAVLALTAFVGYHVHIELEADERFVNLGSGDTSSIDVGSEANHLLLKPRAPTSGTNLTIITNKRAYLVDYRALARAPRADEATYSISFRYAAPPPAPADRADASRTPLHLDARPAARNLDYWYCGSPKLRPIYAADDGLQLQLTFAPDTALPAIYAVSSDGAESLVNTHSERDTVFVHGIAPRLVLRRGSEVGCIVDRSDRGSVRRATSGTIDPGTQRVLNGSEP